MHFFAYALLRPFAQIRRCLIRTAWVAWVGLGLAFLCAAAARSARSEEVSPDVQEVIDCIAANEPDRSSVQEVTFETLNRAGDVARSEAEIHWARIENARRVHGRMLLRMTRPLDLRGSSLLLIEQPDGRDADLFLYLPEVGRSRRVTKYMVDGAVFGTDFTYEDFERLRTLADSTGLSRLPDNEIAGRSVFVLEGRPGGDEGSAYERIVAFVDQSFCVPLRVEFYEPGGGLRKLLHAPPERIELAAHTHVPRELVMHDMSDGSQTRLEVNRIRVDGPVARRTFDPSRLERRGR